MCSKKKYYYHVVAWPTRKRKQNCPPRKDVEIIANPVGIPKHGCSSKFETGVTPLESRELKVHTATFFKIENIR